jgi:tetratricopeptide (TPR) repeat protein
MPSQNDPLHKKTHKPFYVTHPEIIICALLIIVNFITYQQALNFDFVWDDNQHIITNFQLQSGLTSEGIQWAFKIQNGLTYWHPLTFISHMLDIQLFGLNPAGHHLINILIHTANSVLLFFILRLMTGSLWRSAFVAGLFAIHPLNIESVAWISERKNILSTFFWLLTMLAYYWYSQKETLSRYFLVFIVFGLGLLAKPMLVSLPLVLLLLDFWPLNRYQAKIQANNSGNEIPVFFSKTFSTTLIKLVIEKIPFAVIAYLSYLITSLSMAKVSIDDQFFVPTSMISMSLRVSNAFVSYIKYILKLIWPANLACYYPFPMTIPLWQVIGSACLLILITLFCAKNFRKKPYFLIGWLWFCVTMAPVSGIIQAGVWPEMADRWAYVPFIGLFIIIAWGISDITKEKSYLAILIIFSLIIVLNIVVTKYYLQFWKDDVSLYSRAIQVTNNNIYMRDSLSTVLSNQGGQLQLTGKLDEAEQKFIDAILVFPNNKNSYNGLGVSLMLKGDYDGALTNFQKALKVDPDFSIAHKNIALILYQKKDVEGAIFHFKEAVRLNPNNASAKKYLKNVLSKENKKIPTN